MDRLVFNGSETLETIEAMDSADTESDSDLSEGDNSDIELKQQLASWANTCKISHCHLTKLLKILRAHGHAQLPKNGKTILETPRNSGALIRTVEPGLYVHIGIEAGIKYILQKYDLNCLHQIIIDVSIDGANVSKPPHNWRLNYLLMRTFR